MANFFSWMNNPLFTAPQPITQAVATTQTAPAGDDNIGVPDESWFEGWNPANIGGFGTAGEGNWVYSDTQSAATPQPLDPIADAATIAGLQSGGIPFYGSQQYFANMAQVPVTGGSS